MSTPLLEVNNLTVAFPEHGGLNYAVQDLSYTVQEGEIIGIVGESGCGKSISSLAVMGILPTQAKILNGEILFKGTDLLKISKEKHRILRTKALGMIFQNPMSSLNPYLTVGTQLIESLTYEKNISKREAMTRAHEMLERVHIAEAARRLQQYPHELSGGMCQRVMIAMALMNKPTLLIADEPTTALDVTIQAQILSLLSELMEKDELGLHMSIVLISHDIGVISNMADRILVMYAGSMMETSETTKILSTPNHPYTSALLSSIPDLFQTSQDLTSIPGNPPHTNTPHNSCPFNPRCEYAQDICRAEFPPVDEYKGHQYRCLFPLNQNNQPTKTKQDVDRTNA